MVKRRWICNYSDNQWSVCDDFWEEMKSVWVHFLSWPFLYLSTFVQSVYVLHRLHSVNQELIVLLQSDSGVSGFFFPSDECYQCSLSLEEKSMSVTVNSHPSVSASQALEHFSRQVIPLGRPRWRQTKVLLQFKYLSGCLNTRCGPQRPWSHSQSLT